MRNIKLSIYIFMYPYVRISLCVCNGFILCQKKFEKLKSDWVIRISLVIINQIGLWSLIPLCILIFFRLRHRFDGLKWNFELIKFQIDETDLRNFVYVLCMCVFMSIRKNFVLSHRINLWSWWPLWNVFFFLHITQMKAWFIFLSETKKKDFI